MLSTAYMALLTSLVRSASCIKFAKSYLVGFNILARVAAKVTFDLWHDKALHKILRKRYGSTLDKAHMGTTGAKLEFGEAATVLSHASSNY